MFTLDLVINPIILSVVFFVAILFGYSLGRKRLTKSRARVKELEDEMMSSHSEILELQKVYVDLENKLKDLSFNGIAKDQSIPVIPMKINGKDNSKEKATKWDAGPRS
jgi:hypothetical protein